MLKRFALILWFLYIFALTILSLGNVSQMPNLGSSFDDKVYHTLAYFLFTLLTFNILRTKIKTHIVLYSATISVIYGIIIEVLQSVLTEYRVSDFYDVIANCIGVGLAILVINIKKTKIKMN